MALMELIGSFLALSWDFFTELKVPGLDITFAALFVGVFLAVLGLKFLFSILGVSNSSGDVDRAFFRRDK